MMRRESVYRAVGILAALTWTFVAGTAQQAPPPPMPVPAILQAYKPVTPERLLKPDEGDWLMIRRTYDGWGYSPLAQITERNVKRLKPVWSFSTGATSGHQAPPIVNGGVMFVATPGDQVIAIDVVRGTLLWRYRYPTPEDLISLHRTNRGVALLGDKVYLAASDAALVALDAKTGKPAWTTR